MKDQQRLACVPGERSPVNFHSVIDKPDLVRRVRPPRTTMLNTQAEVPPSHHAIAFLAPSDNPALRLPRVTACTKISKIGVLIVSAQTHMRCCQVLRLGCNSRSYLWCSDNPLHRGIVCSQCALPSPCRKPFTRHRDQTSASLKCLDPNS